MAHRFKEYQPYKGDIQRRVNGSMVALETGTAFAYSIDKLQDRGKFFIDPGEDVYMGQVVGEHVHDNDLVVNVAKAKQLTNVRASGSDEKARIIPKTVMSLEECLEYIKEDEYLCVCEKLSSTIRSANVQIRNKQILSIALPSIVSNITVPLLGLIDTSITGHMGSAAYIGAVAIGSMLFNTLYWLFSFLRLSTSGLTSQALGRGDNDEVVRLLTSSLLGALAIALVLVVMQLPLLWLGLWIMAPTEEIAQLGLFCLNGWFIGMQNSRIPMVVAITQNVVNILASLFFVYALNMKVEGVALGTLIAQWCGFIVSLINARRLSPSTLHLSPSTFHLPPSIFHHLSLNSSLFLRTLCLVSVMLFFTSAGSWQGATLLAVNTILMQMFLLVSYVMDGFANAAEAMSGKFYGAADNDAEDVRWYLLLPTSLEATCS